LTKWAIAVLLFLGADLIAQNIFDATRSNDTLKIKTLYALKADTINSKNESGFSPLIIAVYRQQSDAALLLIRLGADLNTNSPEGTALIAASYRGDLNLLNLLLASGAKTDESNDDGVSALMYAAQLNHETIARSLIQHGANKHLRSKAGYSAFDYARKNGNGALFQLLSD
jgi:ankyrin repeat protein